MNLTNIDGLAEHLADTILVAGTTFPMNTASHLDAMIQMYREVGVDAERLKTEIESIFPNKYDLMRTDRSFNAARFRLSGITVAFRRLFLLHFEKDFDLTIPDDPETVKSYRLNRLTEDLRRVEERLANLGQTENATAECI